MSKFKSFMLSSFLATAVITPGFASNLGQEEGLTPKLIVVHPDATVYRGLKHPNCDVCENFKITQGMPMTCTIGGAVGENFKDWKIQSYNEGITWEMWSKGESPRLVLRNRDRMPITSVILEYYSGLGPQEISVNGSPFFKAQDTINPYQWADKASSKSYVIGAYERATFSWPTPITGEMSIIFSLPAPTRGDDSSVIRLKKMELGLSPLASSSSSPSTPVASSAMTSVTTTAPLAPEDEFVNIHRDLDGMSNQKTSVASSVMTSVTTTAPVASENEFVNIQRLLDGMDNQTPAVVSSASTTSTAATASSTPTVVVHMQSASTPSRAPISAAEAEGQALKAAWLKAAQTVCPDVMPSEQGGEESDADFD